MSIGNSSSGATLRSTEDGRKFLNTVGIPPTTHHARPSESSPNQQSKPYSSSRRSIVAGRFMNMLHAHDDARALFLSAHQPRTR